MSQLHLRFDGRSMDLDLNDLDVGTLSADHEIRSAVASHLEVPASKLANYAIDRNEESGEITLRPQAVFGEEIAISLAETPSVLYNLQYRLKNEKPEEWE